MKQIGVLLTLPFVMAIPPVVGWLLGRWLDEAANTKPFFMYTLIVLGIVAGFREMYRIIIRFGSGI